MLELTAVLAVKNGERFLKEALDSVLNQTLPPNEILVINDHSEDSTVEIVRTYGNRVRLIDSSRHGQCAAVNQAIELIKNPLVAFIDHDDIWDERKNELSVAPFKENDELEVVTSGLINFLDKPGIEAAREFRRGRVLGSCTFKVSAFRKVGELREDLTTSSIVEWWSRPAAKELKSALLDERLYRRRIHDENIGIQKKEESRENLLAIVRGLTKSMKN